MCIVLELLFKGNILTHKLILSIKEISTMVQSEDVHNLGQITFKFVPIRGNYSSSEACANQGQANQGHFISRSSIRVNRLHSLGQASAKSSPAHLQSSETSTV